MKRPLRVFLCHASQDKTAVRELFTALQGEGWIDPWLDKAKILPGQDWELVIEKAVDASDVVIVCLSSQSVTKEGFVQREIRYAYDIALEKPEGTIFLIPLRLDDCIVPRKLKSLHWVDYFGAEKDEAYSNLVEALKLRYDQKLQAEEIQREQERQAQKAEELAHQLADERAARAKAEQEAKTEREARLKWERDMAEKVAQSVPEKVKTEQEEPKKQKPAENLAPRFEEKKFIPAVIENKPKQTFPIWGIYASIFFVLAFSAWGISKLANLGSVATQAPNLGIGSTMLSQKDGMTMMYVPAGEFTMGSDNGSDDEKPVHTVYLDAFWIAQTEVTNAMFAKCVNAGKCNPPSNTTYFSNSEYADHPVVYVDWNQADGYCQWVGGRLPTESEWEKAASWDERNQTKYVYPWGKEFSGTNVNFCDINCTYDWANKSFNDGYSTTAPVGSFPKGESPYGLYDMAGNVTEWVSDYYQSDYYSTLRDGASNPQGPASGDYRVLRGGTWSGYDYFVRSSDRDWYNPTDTYDFIGFRCSRSQP